MLLNDVNPTSFLAIRNTNGGVLRSNPSTPRLDSNISAQNVERRRRILNAERSGIEEDERKDREIKGEASCEGTRRDEKTTGGEREPGAERYLLIGPQESSIWERIMNDSSRLISPSLFLSFSSFSRNKRTRDLKSSGCYSSIFQFPLTRTGLLSFDIKLPNLRYQSAISCAHFADSVVRSIFSENI